MVKKQRIFFVEDEQTTHKLIEYKLKTSGYEPIGFDGSDESMIDYAQKGAYDLAILDINLPILSGVVVLNAIRKSKKHRCTPVIMLSAKATDHDIISSLDMGACDYMTKPFSPNQLIARIRVRLRKCKNPK